MPIASLDPVVFVCGSSRSGTTMMGRVFGAHSAIHMAMELHFFERLWTAESAAGPLAEEDAVELMSRLLAHERAFGAFTGASLEPFRAEARRLVASVGRPVTAPQLYAAFLHSETARRGKSIPLEQTPRYVYYIDEILRLFPAARVVVTVRDPRAVLSSQKHKWSRYIKRDRAHLEQALRLYVSYHAVTTTLLWRAAVRAGDRFDGSDRVRVVRFEDVLADPRAEIEALCRFVGVAFEEAMLEVARAGSSFADEEGGRGIDAAAADRWRRRGSLADAEVWLCQRLARAEMRRHGYAPAPVRPGAAALAGAVATLPLKALPALALNAPTFRSLGAGAARRFRPRRA